MKYFKRLEIKLKLIFHLVFFQKTLKAFSTTIAGLKDCIVAEF